MRQFTKAEALKFLSSKLKNDKNIIIPKLFFFEKGYYFKNKNNIILKKLNKFSKSIIIRSSGKDEDGFNSSLAGKYKSKRVKTISKKKIDENIKT